MRLLALETATEACSAALWIDGQLRQREVVAPRAHARTILRLLDVLLAEAGLRPGALDAIAFGRGPGSFTGVRIAAGVAQGVALGAGLPVVPVSTLLALGQAAVEQTGSRPVLAALDARMGEVYALACRPDTEGRMEAVLPEQVAAPEQVQVPAGSGWLGAGSGWKTYGDRLRNRLAETLAGVVAEARPTAAAVARLAIRALERGEQVPAEEAVPVYLRDRVADERARTDG